MPVNESLMNSLKRKYGEKKGEEVYYAMERENKAVFQKGLKTARAHGHLKGGK